MAAVALTAEKLISGAIFEERESTLNNKNKLHRRKYCLL